MIKKNKLIYGWGINDVDYSVYRYERVGDLWKVSWTCPYYQDWKGIIERCFSEKYINNNSTYKGCTIHKDWKYLSNFIKWVDSQPNKDWVNCQLDKDILVEKNKHYGPETVAYISGNLNTFILDCGKVRGDCMIGVSYRPSLSKKNPYIVQCSNPFTGKQDYLGLYPTELEAHLVWKAKKHEHACKLADLQTDMRISKRLMEMYLPDKDLTTQ